MNNCTWTKATFSIHPGWSKQARWHLRPFYMILSVTQATNTFFHVCGMNHNTYGQHFTWICMRTCTVDMITHSTHLVCDTVSALLRSIEAYKTTACVLSWFVKLKSGTLSKCPASMFHLCTFLKTKLAYKKYIEF